MAVGKDNICLTNFEFADPDWRRMVSVPVLDTDLPLFFNVVMKARKFGADTHFAPFFVDGAGISQFQKAKIYDRADWTTSGFSSSGNPTSLQGFYFLYDENDDTVDNAYITLPDGYDEIRILTTANYNQGICQVLINDATTSVNGPDVDVDGKIDLWCGHNVSTAGLLKEHTVARGLTGAGNVLKVKATNEKNVSSTDNRLYIIAAIAIKSGSANIVDPDYTSGTEVCWMTHKMFFGRGNSIISPGSEQIMAWDVEIPGGSNQWVGGYHFGAAPANAYAMDPAVTANDGERWIIDFDGTEWNPAGTPRQVAKYCNSRQDFAIQLDDGGAGTEAVRWLMDVNFKPGQMVVTKDIGFLVNNTTVYMGSYDLMATLVRDDIAQIEVDSMPNYIDIPNYGIIPLSTILADTDYVDVNEIRIFGAGCLHGAEIQIAVTSPIEKMMILFRTFDRKVYFQISDQNLTLDNGDNMLSSTVWSFKKNRSDSTDGVFA